MRLSRILLPLLSALVLLVPALSSAQDGPVTRYVRERHDQVNEMLRHDPPGAARDAAVGAIIDGLLDFDALSRAALAAHWDEMNAAQQAEFVSILQELTRNSYLGNLQNILDFEVTYGGETDITGGTRVATTARSRTERRSEPVEIAYSMHNVGGAWRAFDVTTAGVSMVANYRRQFHSIISEHGIAGLLERMRTRRDRERD